MGVRAMAVAALLGASTISIAGAATPCDQRVNPSCTNYPILNPGEAVETEAAQPRSPLRIGGERRAKRAAAKRGRHATRLASAKRKLKQARRERTKVAAISKRRGARPGVRLATIAKRAAEVEVEVASAQDDLTFGEATTKVAMPRPKPAALAVAEAVSFDAPTPEEEAAAQAEVAASVETTGGASLEERVADAVIPSAHAATLRPLGVIPATVRPAEFASAGAPREFDITPLRAAFMAFGGLLVLGTVARLMIA